MNGLERQAQMAAPAIESIPILLNQAGIPTRELTDIKGPAPAVAIEARFWGEAAAVTRRPAYAGARSGGNTGRRR